MLEIREVHCADGSLIVVEIPRRDLRPNYHLQNIRTYMRGQGLPYPRRPTNLPF